MKESIKFILIVIISVVLSSIISIGANTLLQADKVNFKTSNGDNVDVNSALDRLFNVVDINARLGSTDISSIGDGTITGAINSLNTNVNTSQSSSVEVVLLKDNITATGSYNIDYTGYKYVFIEVGFLTQNIRYGQLFIPVSRLKSGTLYIIDTSVATASFTSVNVQYETSTNKTCFILDSIPNARPVVYGIK